MTRPDPLVSRLEQAVRDFGEDRPVTWRACRAVSDILETDGASITIEN